jgi:DNA-binding PadR family transcriptional regulator
MATNDPIADDSTTTTTDSETTDAYPPTDLTRFQADLLRTVIALGSPHGLAIKEDLEAHYGEIHHGQLYPNLDTVVEKGLVTKGERDRRTNYYEITARGQRELEAYVNWMGEALED